MAKCYYKMWGHPSEKDNTELKMWHKNYQKAWELFMSAEVSSE
jgi:hypothetical protein